jgi:phage terminase small subunit
MPARKKSLTLLKLSGGLKNHPGRYAGRTDLASCPDGIGEAPAHISIARKHIWAEVINQLPEGHLQSADRFLLEIVTHLMSRQRNRRTLITKGEVSLLINALSKLGLTPVDRSRVIIPVKPQKNAYSEGWDDLDK